MDKDSDPTPITIINGQKQNHLASENDDLTLYDAGFPVVGIGASAGGLDVFKRFFIAMPADAGSSNRQWYASTAKYCLHDSTQHLYFYNRCPFILKTAY